MSQTKIAQDGKETLYKCGSLIYTKKGLFAVFAWLLWGDFCFTLMMTVVPSIVPLKLTSLGASGTLTSLVMTSLPAIFNFTITPTISIWSDRLRTRWGRRMPFILGSLPFLTVSLLLIGFNEEISRWIQSTFLQGSGIDQARVAIIVLATCVAMFELFNMFVATVYWYLFNDVVPEQMLGRFMSYFRLVGTLAGMLYNFFVFQFAESHMREIYIAVAVLYGVGFGLMCWRVKEGTYPPPEDLGETQGFWQGIRKTAAMFWKECFTSKFYWYFMLDPAIACLAAFAPFQVFFNKSLGLTLGNIGIMQGIAQGGMLACFLFVGRLVDRWHPVRTTAYMQAFAAFTAFGGWIWLVVDKPNAHLYMWLSAIFGVLFFPIYQSLLEVGGMTRWMRLLPKEKLGQFNGAMCLVRAFAIFIAGFLAGFFIDLVKFLNPPSTSDPEGLFGYRYIFLISGCISAAAFFFHYKVFRVWKRLGGETSYVAPDSTMDVSNLPPREGDQGRVAKGLLAIPCWVGFGGILFQAAFMAYYMRWEPNSAYAGWFAASVAFQSVVLFLYWRFIHFMERP